MSLPLGENCIFKTEILKTGILTFMIILLNISSGCTPGVNEQISNASENKDDLLHLTSNVSTEEAQGSADDKYNSLIGLSIGNSTAVVFGKKTTIDSGNSRVVPFIDNGRTLVPVRFVSEGLGAKVNWNDIEKTSTIESGNITIKIKLNQKSMLVNNKEVTMDVAAIIKDNRIFIPLRYITEALNKNIFYLDGLIVISPIDFKIDATSDKEKLDRLLSEIKEQDEGQDPLALLKIATSWAYQLQNLEAANGVEALVKSKYDMVVIEPTRTVKDNLDFNTKDMVRKIKASKGSDGIRRKLVIAYINIAEAEDWRWYWKWDDKVRSTWPSYIIGADPEGWIGDYPVAYWNKDWKNIIIYGSEQTKADGYSSLMEEVLADGFDGVYLDWVEGYSEDIVAHRGEQDKVDPKKEMVNFLGEMRKYSKAKNKDFLIIQQNAAELYKGFPEAFDYVDAVAQEAIWYDGTTFEDWNDPDGADKAQDAKQSKNYVENLKKYKEQGKVIFNVEYADKYKDEAFKLSRENGFVPYCSKRPLSELL